MIEDINDVADYFACKPTAEDIARCLYKDTYCGASVEIEDNGITLTSIVEGFDAEFKADKLYYPFSKDDLANTIEWIENRVTEFIEEES